MRSPFPGMDPYLEQFWGDVHHTMINRSHAAIQKQLPGDLVARVDERDFGASNGVAVAEPLVVHIEQDEPVRQGFIEIIDLKSGRRVVTVVEVICPSNKVAGPGRDLYIKKQDELRQSGVSLVAIDLNRTGSRVFSAPFELIPDGHRTPNAACVRRGWKALAIEYYRLPLRERLPAIAIPLRQTDRDIPLDLQAVLDECAGEGRYVDDIDYSKEPDPPLDRKDAEWADTLLRDQGLR
jgi:Protein of unknown function (DUF4058)